MDPSVARPIAANVDQSVPVRAPDNCDSGWRDALAAIGGWLIVPILLWAAYLRTRSLDRIGPQFDESFLQRIVEFPWEEMLERVGRDNHPPLFHVLLKLWSQVFGAATGTGRLLSMVWGVAGVAGVYQFTREAYRTGSASPRREFREATLPALTAALLLAVAPLHLLWSMHIRMYSLAVALAVWSSYFLWRALYPRGASGWWWGAYTLTATLLAYSHYFGLFTLAAQYAYAFVCSGTSTGSTRLRRMLPPLASVVIVVLAWLPWLPTFLSQRARVAQEFTLLPPLSWYWLDRVSHELWFGLLEPFAPTWGLAILQLSFVTLLLVLAGRRPADLFVCLSVGVPVAAATTLSIGSRPIITAKYFLLAQAFLLIGAAVVACRLPRILRATVLGLILAGMFAATWRQQQRWAAFAELPGMAAAAARLDSARSGEPLLINSPMVYCCALTDLSHREGVYIHRPGRDFVYFHGTAAIADDRYVNDQWINRQSADFVWTLEGQSSIWQPITMPSEWSLVREETYNEWYATLAVRLYQRSVAGSQLDPREQRVTPVTTTQQRR